MTSPLPDLPSGFRCPYRRTCWQREIWRGLVTVVIACLATYAAGCYIRLQAPGIEIESAWTWPSSQPTAPMIPLKPAK